MPANASWLSINAVTLATSVLKKSVAFYVKLGLVVTWSSANFTTLAPADAATRSALHINLFRAALPPPPDPPVWNGLGRTIFYVEDVDSLYALAVRNGLRPEHEPRDAPWGERYFPILDPMGHELSLARPIRSAADEPQVVPLTLEQRVARLERAATGATQLPADPCATAFPSLRDGDVFAYAGCNRNVHRNSTTSMETCQNGTLRTYNTSSTEVTGLFDLSIAANIPTHDKWDFVCALSRDEPHRAVCTLTFETPKRPEGPAWLSVRFTKVGSSSSGACRARNLTIEGTYFYDGLTNNAGVYVFYATSRSSW